VIRNRSYQNRVRRAGLVSCGQIFEDLVERTADRRRKRRSRNLHGGVQLERFADQPVPRDTDRPQFDLLPKAYEGL
jgi:hypothetical protein